ncbi:MAG TPA: amylo-alpha-1,6-glucosidase [Thermoanaerobaculia bacterium]|nr:amylo-alpha-1,6-glucosidase [Thermoanaerobaculia bacterium]
MLPLTIPAALLRDFERASRLEWLETDGLGGFSSSTLTGAHSRRYHGLLVAAVVPPAERAVLLSRLDETLRIAGKDGSADTVTELWCARFPGAIHAKGYQLLDSFRREMFPEWEYLAGHVRLRKTVAAIWGESTRVVLYELMAAPGSAKAAVELELRPLFAARGYHELGSAARPFRHDASFDGVALSYEAHDGVPAVFVSVPHGRYLPAPDWYQRFEYAEELARGFDGHEDLFTPGVLRVALRAGEPLAVVVSTEPSAGRDGLALLAAERRRREGLLRKLPSREPLPRTLALAGDQFVVCRGEHDATVIAGYPWFTDWGRDTMISLAGLCLSTGRHLEAQATLRAFAGAMREGLVPNRFQDRGGPPEYNTVDATLWLFVAVRRYLDAARENPAAVRFVRQELWPALEDSYRWHRRGTRHGIQIDDDGLLWSGAEGAQLTWMDARIGEWVVTPRRGKPVEIQTLWINALLSLTVLRERFGLSAAAAKLRARADAARSRFLELFWDESRGYLADCVEQLEGATPNAIDASLRPNQILALGGLPHALLDGERAESVLRAVEAKLLTPRGLRSLSPDDPAYRPRYEGGPLERDSAYHQGTVWPWLLGAYADALCRVRGATGREQARQMLAAFAEHIGTEGCIGSVSEVFHGDPPHTPGGCPAQAWSVAELLRVALALDVSVTGEEP